MKKIVLVCSAGMSTNLLITHMEEAANEYNESVEIIAVPSSTLEEQIIGADLVLLSPQVRFQKAKIEEIILAKVGHPLPIDTIDMKFYSTMNGRAIFESAMSLLK